MTKLKLVCEATYHDSKSGYYVVPESLNDPVGYIKSIFKVDHIPEVVPDYISIEQKELYYYFNKGDEPMSQKIVRYHKTIDGLGLKAEKIKSKIFMPIFYTDIEELFLNNMTISIRLDSGLISFGFGNDFNLLSKWNIRSAVDLIGGNKNLHSQMMSDVFQNTNIIPDKLFGFTIFLQDGQLIDQMAYYFRLYNMTKEEISRFEEFAKYKILDLMNTFSVYRKQCLSQICFRGSDYHCKYFYTDGGR